MSTPVERDFLIRKALFIVCSQFGKNFKPDYFDVRSIPGKKDYPYGYEIWTVRLDDYFRCRIYLDIDKEESLSSFSLRLEENYYAQGPGDEVYVAYGTVSYEEREVKNFSGLPMGPDPLRSPVLMLDSEFVLLADENTMLAL